MKAWEEKTPFKDLLLADPEVTARLSPEEIDALFDPSHHLRHMGVIIERVEGLAW